MIDKQRIKDNLIATIASESLLFNSVIITKYLVIEAIASEADEGTPELENNIRDAETMLALELWAATDRVLKTHPNNISEESLAVFKDSLLRVVKHYSIKGTSIQKEFGDLQAYSTSEEFIGGIFMLREALDGSSIIDPHTEVDIVAIDNGTRLVVLVDRIVREASDALSDKMAAPMAMDTSFSNEIH